MDMMYAVECLTVTTLLAVHMYTLAAMQHMFVEPLACIPHITASPATQTVTLCRHVRKHFVCVKAAAKPQHQG